MSDLITSKLGEYRVDAPVGQSAIGQMYRGSHVLLDTPVTLVVIDSVYTSTPAFQTRLAQYVQQIVGLSHPHVIRTFVCNEQSGLFYIVMESVSGGALKALPSGSEWNPMNWLAVGFIHQAAQGLAAVHARGLTHGNVQLSNLLLTSTDIGQAKVKVSEVGLRQLAGDASTVTDVVALGGLLYEVTTGRPAAHASRGDFPSGMPDGLKTVVRRCLSDDPRLQFASCEELAQVLGKIIDASKSAAMPVDRPTSPVGAVAPVVDPMLNIGAQTQPKPPAPPRRGRRAAPKPPEPLPAGELVPCLHIFDDGHAPVAKQFVRGAGITIGRDRNRNTIVLDHMEVSAEHAQIGWDGNQRITITDRSSQNGTFYKGEQLLPQLAQEWGEDAWVEIGPYWLWLQRPGTGPVADEGIEVILDQQSRKMELTPGRSVQCRLALVNRKAAIEQATISVQGIPQEWVQVQGEHPVPVGKYGRADVVLAINVPRTPAARAGSHTVAIVAKPVRDSDAGGSATAQWTVLPFEDMSVQITPSRSGGRRQARYNLTLQHRGNFPASYVLTGSDDEKQLDVLFTGGDVTDRKRLELKDLQPGPATDIKVKVQAPKRWFGSSKNYPFGIQAAPLGPPAQQPLTAEGQFNHRAIFPVWMMAVAPLLLIALVLLLPPVFKPVVRSVSPEPANPLAGDQVELFWDTSRERRIRILVNEVPVKPEPDTDALKYVFPKGFERDTRVRVIASNIFGSDTKEITITPTPRPPVEIPPAEITEFKVTPTVIGRPDQPVQIRWRTAKAERVEIDPIGTVEREGTTTYPTPGEQIFTLKAYNKANVATTRSVTVRLRGGPSSPSELSLTVLSGTKLNKGVLESRLGQPIFFQWSAKNAQMSRLEGAGSSVMLQGPSGQQRAVLLGKGMYQFTLVTMGDGGQEVRSAPIVIKGTCSTSIFSEIATLGKAGCKDAPEVRWQ